VSPRMGLVERANAQVPIQDLLRDLFGITVPREIVKSWKIRCPFGGLLHPDGGVEKNSRVYEDNHMYCWTCEQSFRPVDLMASWSGMKPTDAARKLLRDHHLLYAPTPESRSPRQTANKAEEFLRGLALDEAPKSVEEVRQLARDAGITFPAWATAAHNLGLRDRITGTYQAEWEGPLNPITPPSHVKVGDTYTPSEGPHEGHQITVEQVAPGACHVHLLLGEDCGISHVQPAPWEDSEPDAAVTVLCACGERWTWADYGDLVGVGKPGAFARDEVRERDSEDVAGRPGLPRPAQAGGFFHQGTPQSPGV
jgi:hypothetical protein